MSTLAIDCMGGDFGAEVTVPAALDFLKATPDTRLILVGLKEKIEPFLADVDANLKSRIEILHASEIVDMDEPPAHVLRHKKDSSMRRAIDCVKEGRADAVVSAGNTGALMATSYLVLKMLPGIERPAICTNLPTQNGHVLMLDLGANVDCDPQHLLQFALMGSCLVSAMEHKDSPKVGLLNIGEEAMKGNLVVKNAADLLNDSALHFVGNVEGDGIFKNEVDVIVCDGFVGNVALKAAEGVAQMIGTQLKAEFRRNFFTKMVALCAIPIFKRLKARFDHRRYNGAVLLGLRGVCVKSHGSADIFSFINALSYAHAMVKNQVLVRIQQQLAAFEEQEPL